MPAAFDKCVKDGGTVVTKPLKGNKFIHLCKDKNGNWHQGEVKTKKSEANMSEDLTNVPEQAKAAIKFESFEVKTDGTNEGTMIMVNGKEVKNLRTLHFNCWKDGLWPPIDLSYTVDDPSAADGQLAETKYVTLNPPRPDEEGVDAKLALSSELLPQEHLPRDKARNELWKQL